MTTPTSEDNVPYCLVLDTWLLGGEAGDAEEADLLKKTTPEGRIQATRSRKERERNPDRITLDRRGLTQLPVIVGEPRLRLLSLQHNLLARLDGLSALGLCRLVFLDLYDNQLERISGLDTLINLRVLLIGKNRIRRIEGLSVLSKLEVLDLHGNQIYQVGGLSTLGELKVLNLAGNQIRVIGATDLQGLRSLQEMNLRRNRIKQLQGFTDTPQLQKLFFSNNELLTVENMRCIVKATQLREVSVDGNPVALGGDCVSFLVSYLPQLRLLSRMEITPAVRDAAMGWRNTHEAAMTGRVDSSSDVRREEVISNARTNWELLRSQTRCSSSMSLSSSLRDLRMDREFDLKVLSDRNVHSDSGLGSTASSVCTDPKGIVPISAEVRRLNFSRRTVSHESKGSIKTVSSNSVDFFKLPPILAVLSNTPTDKLGPAEISSGETSAGLRRCDSLSSVEPNVDSSQSSLTSDSSSGSSSGEEDDLVSSEEPPIVISKVCEKPLSRNIKSATQYRKHLSRRIQARATTSRPQQKTVGKVREQGGDFLVEICGRVLNVYGQGSLRFIDRPWSAGKASDVNTVKFNYVNFNSMVYILPRIKQRFPGAEHFLFRETNIFCLGQLNALADIQGLSSLRIEMEGNPIIKKDWRSYAIYRLSHWGLHMINDKEITEEEITSACDEFQPLSNIVLLSLPDTLLQPLLTRLHLEGNRSNNQPSAKQWLFNADPALRSVVSKEALQWRKGGLSQEDIMWRRKGRAYLSDLLDTTCAAVEKLHMLEEQWPSILSELVTETLVDYSHLDSYMKKCMQGLKL
uniref:Dynein axonemal assembly factor 1 homolog n=1 Tax=Timema californicum TaxID=61474 RepID=A0A7R9JEA7_TIMCA|nr:unnamed protein product [Timema californicum]